MPAAPTSPSEFLDLLRKSGVVPPERLSSAIPDLDALPPEPPKLAALLVRKGVLTRFQAQQLLAGRHRGFRLGAYAVLDQLGRGGMGAVYLAEHLELQRKVAIKVLVAAKEEDQKLALERFLREARAAAALDHPNIVRIFDVCRHGEVPYLVMEYVDGETLQQVLDRDGVVPYTTAADYVAQAAAGLQHAHEKGFVHRDIKPANLIKDRSGTIKILDMGLARSNTNASDRLTEKLDAGAVVGTADYIAPEQALNTPNVDIRADIYSLGATFFSLVTGKPPFEGNTAQKLLHHQITAPPSLAQIDATLPKGLAGVAAKMMAKKPNDRYSTPAEVIAALAPWLGNSTRVLAGITKTNLGQGAELHATLQDFALRSSTRLGTSTSDSSDVNPGSPVRDTDTFAAVVTTCTPSEPAPMPVKRNRKHVLVFAVLGLAALLGAGAAAFVTLRGSPSDTTAATLPPPSTEPPPPVTSPVSPPVEQPKPKLIAATPPPKTPITTANDAPIFLSDFTGLKPFVIRSTVEVSPTNPMQKTAKVLAQSGGTPPKGWSGRCYNPETQMEYFAEINSGRPCLGIRNVKGPGSAMLFMPEFRCPTGACRLVFDYSASVRPGKFAVRFKPTQPSAVAWDVDRPAVTGQLWGSKDIIVNLKGATAGFFEFHNADETPNMPVLLRNLRVDAAPEGSVSTIQLPPPGSTTPSGPDYSRWREGARVYEFDAGLVAPFRITKGGGQPGVGVPEILPPGVACRCWKPTARGEFRRADLDGVPALGLTNFTDEMSAQFTFDLEKGINLVLKPGTVYRVTLSYLTKNDAAGNMLVQGPDYKSQASAKLTTTGGAWKDATATFERKDGVPVRVAIDNTTVGEGNTLYFRSLRLVELTPPAKP